MDHPTAALDTHSHKQAHSVRPSPGPRLFLQQDTDIPTRSCLLEQLYQSEANRQNADPTELTNSTNLDHEGRLRCRTGSQMSFADD